MNAMIISGSERRLGITATVSEKCKSLLVDLNVITHIIYLNEVKLSPCDGCGGNSDGCNYRTSPCEKKDDIPAVINMMINSDIIIYASPVHAFGISHLMQIFLERAGVGYLRFNRPLVNKLGGCIIVGRKYHLGHAHDQIINNMLLNRMIIPGAGFPVLIHGDEDNKNILDTEEIVALEQMIYRLVEIHNSINFQKLQHERINERELKKIKEASNEK